MQSIYILHFLRLSFRSKIGRYIGLGDGNNISPLIYYYHHTADAVIEYKKINRKRMRLVVCVVHGMFVCERPGSDA